MASTEQGRSHPPQDRVDVRVWLGTDNLGSRDLGRRLRTFLMERMAQADPVTLDFSGVDVMTSAFADECFGKLWDRFGTEAPNLVHIKGLTGNNHVIFRFVLAHRT